MNIDLETNDIRGIVITLLNSLRKNIDFKPIINDHNKIDNYKNYIFSRYIEKLTSISANYIRIDWIINKLNFSEIDNLISDDKEKLNDESLIELVATILRPLTEIYLEIKCIELNQKKFSIDIETSCELLFFDSRTESFNLKRNISNEIYNCDPKYFKLWCDAYSKDLNEIKQKFSTKDILLLKNIKNKYKGILDNYGKAERMILGSDYFTHYAILSRKTHFSYTNIPFSQWKPSFYLAWCLLYIMVIYEHIMRMLEFKDEIYDNMKPIIKFTEDSIKGYDLCNIGDYIFVEFGVAIVRNIKNLTYEIEYYISNCFNSGEVDFLPRIFLIGKVDKIFLETVKIKYYPNDLEIYKDSNYDLFYEEIYKHSAPKTKDFPLSRRNM